MQELENQLLTDVVLPGMVVVFVIGAGVILLYQHFQKNLFAQKLKQETLRNIHQADLLRTSISVQEEERKRIAEDLHDELGAVLSIIRMNMVMLEQQVNEQPPSLSSLQNIRQLSETALASMRSISHRLMPPQLKSFGLIKTLEYVVNNINNTERLKVTLHSPEDPEELPWNINLGLYRVIMELLNNTIKHAEATEVVIDIKTEAGEVTCAYTDDGKGLGDTSAAGLGHKNIEGRINALDGKVNMHNGDQGGFYAYISVPLPLSQQEQLIGRIIENNDR